MEIKEACVHCSEINATISIFIRSKEIHYISGESIAFIIIAKLKFACKVKWICRRRKATNAIAGADPYIVMVIFRHAKNGIIAQSIFCCKRSEFSCAGIKSVDAASPGSYPNYPILFFDEIKRNIVA